MKAVVLRGGTDAASRVIARPGGSSRSRGALALSSDGRQWVLVNVSPTVANQLESDPRLRAHAGLPDAEVRAVVLTDAQVDHVAGLLGLRDGAPIDLYATPAVFEQLTDALPVLPVLQQYCGVHWRVVPVAGECASAAFCVQGLPDVEFIAVAIDHPKPAHALQGRSATVGDCIALGVHDLQTGQRLFCIPELASVGPTEVEWMSQADCIFVASGAPQPDLLRQLAALGARRKVMLAAAPDAAQQQALHSDLQRHGIELAFDGMEIAL